MEIDLVWLLVLPLLFALGWITARYDWGQQRRESQHVPQDILNGMSAVLSDDFKKATDLLLSAATSAPDAVDLHRAVGNLYRKRGLVDRAIEVHERALQHPDAPTTVRIALMLDLGRDYLAAGLFDRAQAVLEDLLAVTDLDRESRHHALGLLLAVAERTRDWAQAIERVQALQADGAQANTTSGAASNTTLEGALGSHTHEQLMGHYHCELAQAALARGDLTAAAACLDAAQAFAVAEGPARRITMMRQHIESTKKDNSGGQAGNGGSGGAFPKTVAEGEAMACKVCGFRSRQIYWQCPGCHHWDSFGAVK